MAYHGSLGEVSNKEDWVQPFVVLDKDTAAPVDIVNAEIKVAVVDQNSKNRVLTATEGNGVTISSTETGHAEWNFPAAQMHGLCPETYSVGVTVTLNGTTTQLFAGTVEIYDGIV